jgi:hypothetical protein
MNKITGVTLRDTRVQLDNMHYDNCTFERCVMVYAATGPVGLTNNNINECLWTFEGPAAETVKFMAEFYKVQPHVIEQIFDSIRRGHQPTSEPPPEFPDTIP